MQKWSNLVVIWANYELLRQMVYIARSRQVSDEKLIFSRCLSYSCFKAGLVAVKGGLVALEEGLVAGGVNNGSAQWPVRRPHREGRKDTL